MYWPYRVMFYILGGCIVIGLAYLGWQWIPRGGAPGGDPAPQPAIGAAGAPAAVPPGPTVPAVTPPATGSAASGAGSAPVAGQPVGPGGNSGLAALLGDAESQMQATNIVAARTLAEQVMQDPAVQPYDRYWMAAAAIVSKANTTLINSTAPAPEKVRYVVKAGDSLAKIARDHRSTVEALQRGNRMEPHESTIYPGQTLAIYQADWSLLAIKSRFLLVVKDGARVFKVYRCGIGRQNRTPVGTFEIVNKQREPVWTPPGRVIPYGDKENVLGTRWLGLKSTGTTDPSLKGFGIHGTWEPETVGTAASEGCIRLCNQDVDELFDIVPPGTPVEIREE